MRQIRRDLDSGKLQSTPEFEAEVERDANRAAELEGVVWNALLEFCRKYPESQADVIAPPLLRVAALHLMGGWGMSVEDFAETARSVGEDAVEDAAELRRLAHQVGQG
jgi:hypothetical protein